MQKIGSWVLLAALAVGTVYFFWFWPGRAALAAFSPVRSGGQTLVLDAGHGGEDGGAVSHSGVPESGINLAIVQKQEQLLGLYGEAPLLLRSEDISLHDDSAQTLREKKVSDLHNRVARIEETEHAVLLSVHQNTFPDGKYHGAQVFYSNGELSQPLAQLTQETLRAALDPGNTREAKPIPDSVYLMNHITCPAILVECGFLSMQRKICCCNPAPIRPSWPPPWPPPGCNGWTRRGEGKAFHYKREASPQNESKNTVLLYRVRK